MALGRSVIKYTTSNLRMEVRNIMVLEESIYWGPVFRESTIYLTSKVQTAYIWSPKTDTPDSSQNCQRVNN